jgi:hypothetical protein
MEVNATTFTSKEVLTNSVIGVTISLTLPPEVVYLAKTPPKGGV